MSSTLEFESSVAAPRLFKAAVLEWHKLGPKVLPEIVASTAPVEGEGGVGSIRQINFTAAMPFSYVKERLDLLDADKFECKSTLVEGGHIGKKLETASTHFKFEPKGNDGCVVKVVLTYKTLPGVEVADELAKAKESVIGMFKATEAYLQANPTAYC